MINLMLRSVLMALVFTSWFGELAAAEQSVTHGEHQTCTESVFGQLNRVEVCTWSDQQIKLIMIPTPDGSKSSSPLLYLLGGPGGRADVHIQHMQLLAARLNRPVLLPDSADSFPDLDCRRTDIDEAQWGVAREATDAVFYTRELQRQRLSSCLRQVKVSPALISEVATEKQAKRLQTLRQLLGIETWAVMAESYGSRVALSLAEIDGGHISRLILDSPETPWVPAFWHTGENFYLALQRLSEMCRDEYLCPAYRIRLEERLTEQVALFKRDMVEPLALRDLYSRKTVAYARPTQEQLLITAFMALRSPERAELLPYIAASNNDETLKKRYGLLLSQLLRPGGSLNVGFHHVLRCAELPLAQWYESLAEDRVALPSLEPLLVYLDWRQRHVCEALDISSPSAMSPPPPTDVPTLVLSGGLDPVTPADVVAAAFSGVVHQRYDTLGHIVHSQRDCVLTDVITFVRDGTLPETTCGKKELELKFFTPVMRR